LMNGAPALSLIEKSWIVKPLSRFPVTSPMRTTPCVEFWSRLRTRVRTCSRPTSRTS
jgi:hypothetical protein